MMILAMSPDTAPPVPHPSRRYRAVKPPLFPRDCLDQRTPVAKAFDRRVSDIFYLISRQFRIFEVRSSVHCRSNALEASSSP
jgi:hypothetical protein